MEQTSHNFFTYIKPGQSVTFALRDNNGEVLSEETVTCESERDAVSVTIVSSNEKCAVCGQLLPRGTLKTQ